MKRVGIWGAGNKGRLLIKYLLEHGYEVETLTDADLEKQGTDIDGVRVETTTDFLDKVRVGNVDSVIFAIPSKFLKEVTALFKGCNNIEGYILLWEKIGEKDIGNALYKIDLSKPRLRFLQLNLVQHCNLNCKGCANYSNLIENPTYADFNQVVSDWTKIKDYFWGVERMKLMGGEPLLNPELVRYIKACREIFPDTEIEIGTNGILISEQKKDLFIAMKENNAEFVISLYKPMTEKIKRVEALLQKEGVRYRIIYSKNEFFKYLSETPKCTEEEGYSHCVAKGCNCLENGYISVCSKPLYANRLNAKFGTKLPTECGKWNIYTTEFNGWQLASMLSQPYEFCSYCVEPVYYEWDRAVGKTIQKEDWFV